MSRPKNRLWWLKLVAATLFCACGLGLVGNHFWIWHRVHEDVRRLQAIVTAMAQADRGYSNLHVGCSTHPKAWILGTVDSPQQVAALRAKVAESFSPGEAARIVSNIRVGESATRVVR